jgi:hypothetical protein
MPMAPRWSDHADAGDFAAASAAWAAEFAGRERDLDAGAALGELEERWGDWIWFACEAGAAAHYAAAQAALMPQGASFSDGDEAARRQEAFSRIVRKHQHGIGPDGLPRREASGLPHPRSVLRPPPAPTAPAPSPAPASGPGPTAAGLPTTPPSPPTPPVRPPAVAADPHAALSALARRKPTDPLGLLVHGVGHWEQVDLGERWLAVAKALRGLDAAAARRALEQAWACFDRYHEAWIAGLPASRWDADYADTLQSVAAEIATLPAGRPGPGLPDWARLALELRLDAALAKAATSTEPVFAPLAELLATAKRLGGR